MDLGCGGDVVRVRLCPELPLSLEVDISYALEVWLQ